MRVRSTWQSLDHEWGKRIRRQEGTSENPASEECLASLPDYRPGRLARRAIVHGHCHQKALVGMEPTRQVLSKVERLELSILDSGYCGMAGSFGYEQGHYEVSQACGERALFPAVRGTQADAGKRDGAADDPRQHEFVRVRGAREHNLKNVEKVPER